MPCRKALFIAGRMLNLAGDEAIRIALECPQTCIGAELNDLPAIESAGILVMIIDLTSANCLLNRLAQILLHKSLSTSKLSTIMKAP